ncbi:hypothetical protein QK290_05840 [Pseudarthrobacter sp. AL07]|uniref:DUF3800 domain-containing protein n=1 Tax=unclassified Pseudarthrobacter TaxID=2647000 RepID=UPI00249AF3E7|nr:MULTISPECIES: hypothetical protein [unclassified Pseudarthrobacter]MDI3193991.1 hypothetical protein [Pseudarthrobacter sp. AL20]MDI3208048.1 hypothetical protein [Pseudarthrobacter sp. AL07]
MNSFIPPGAHVFVDESKTKAYYVAASVIAPADVVAARQAIPALCRPGQRRVHFKGESDSSRNAFLKGAARAGLTTRLYVARNLPDKIARPLCLERLIDDLLAAGASRLVLESDESLEQADRRIIGQPLRSRGENLKYLHCKPHEEPLLWVSDAVAWCHQRGGDWISRAAPLVQNIVNCDR